MNKRIMFIVLMTFHLWCLAWGDSYLISLKNGNELRTSHYWEEGEEIKFYVYGGIVGIPKHSVTGFKKSTSSFSEYTGKIENDLSLRDQTMIDKTSAQLPNGKLDETIDVDYYQEKKADLKGKLEEALEKNREATRVKDPEAKEATRQEMLKHAEQLHALEDELREKNNGTLPDWWKE